MRKVLIVGMAFGLTGCASSPSNVTVAYVSLVNYDSYTCAQLTREADRASVQDGKRGPDSSTTQATIVVPWPAASLPRGPGGYATAPGTIESIRKASATKNCALTLQPKRQGSTIRRP